MTTVQSDVILEMDVLRGDIIQTLHSLNVSQITGLVLNVVQHGADICVVTVLCSNGSIDVTCDSRYRLLSRVCHFGKR